MSERRPVLWRLAAAGVVDQVPAVYASLASLVLDIRQERAQADTPQAGAGKQSDLYRPTRPEVDLERVVLRSIAASWLLWGWVNVALIVVFARTPGGALLKLRFVRSDGGRVGILRAWAHIFAPEAVLTMLYYALRAAPIDEPAGTAVAALVPTAVITMHPATVLIDHEHRTLWNRTLGTRRLHR
jgi:hypothetical protein